MWREDTFQGTLTGPCSDMTWLFNITGSLKKKKWMCVYQSCSYQYWEVFLCKEIIVAKEQRALKPWHIHPPWGQRPWTAASLHFLPIGRLTRTPSQPLPLSYAVSLGGSALAGGKTRQQLFLTQLCTSTATVQLPECPLEQFPVFTISKDRWEIKEGRLFSQAEMGTAHWILKPSSLLLYMNCQ